MARILSRSPNTNNTTNAWNLNTDGNINNNNCSNTNGARPALVDKVRPSKRKLKAAPPQTKGSHILPTKGKHIAPMPGSCLEQGPDCQTATTSGSWPHGVFFVTCCKGGGGYYN